MSNELPVLKRGAYSTTVRLLQRLLNAEGLCYPALTVDQDFGAGTLNAVLEFQRREGLSADGVVGSMSWAALIDNDRSRGIYEAWKQEALYPSSGKNWAPSVKRVSERYGEIIQNNAMELGFETAAGIAVLAVESGGSGLTVVDSAKVPLIRFEVHAFKRRSGASKDSANGFAGGFHEHFRITPGYEKEPWLPKGHQMRESAGESWEFIHSPADQAKEYQALIWGANIDEDAAYKSISMGAAQVMGWWHTRCGYESAKEMFEAFHDEGAQIDAFFTFLKNGSPEKDNGADLFRALQEKDWYDFALGYNGPGQPKTYGPYLNDAYKAAKSLLN